jgi:hypothetical protein
MQRHVVVASFVSLLAAGTASAVGVPDPVNSRCPDWIIIVGKVNGGSTPDVFGRSTFTVKDFANNPILGATVTDDLSACCDITLCAATANGLPVAVNGNRVTGFTNANGQVEFIFMGAARDPGTSSPPDVYGGCGLASARPTMFADGVLIQCPNSTTIVTLDQNGAAGQSNGTTTSDVSNLLNLYGSVSLGAPYRARGDVDQSGNISIADVSALLGHLGRLSLAGGVGCGASPYNPGPGCP